MTQFARGLKLVVTDRDALKAFIEENAFDPGVHLDCWSQNAVPKIVYIAEYEEDDPSYYKAYDEHVNGEVSQHYWGEPLLEDAIEAGVLEKTDEYDTEFVDRQ